MPRDLTGNSISDVYSSFLHLSATSLTSTFQPVFDGIGVTSPLQVSTSGLRLDGSVQINRVTYPGNKGDQGSIVYVIDSTGRLGYTSLLDLLRSDIGTALPIDGVYSNPRVTITEGIVSKVQDNPTINTFYIRNFNPTTRDYITAASEDWPYPVINDVAFIRNLANDGLIKLRFTGESGTGWVIEKTI
jgi:hypothetical protein